MQSNTRTIAELKDLALQLPEKIPYLKMLVLFGSRATGNTHANSDWDFAVLCDEEQRQAEIKDNIGRLFELPMLIGEVLKINADHIDIVQLNHCSELIAHFVARDGQVLYENEVKEFKKFKQKVLLSNSEIKKIEHTKRKNIEQFLARWGV
ncbi:MAG: nucleotidyltransferase domain-containing protein [Nodularia sp. (in: Bacteria)]|nr:MAG: nucleotidyltransferase domain-containing protein [Nodularia sp. (in: cyanobacteria)]